MRINFNKKFHKQKRDPYQLLLKTVGVLGIVVVVSLAVFFLCRGLIENEFVGKRAALDEQNMEAEQEFNARINALRSSNSARATQQEDGEERELLFWERTLEDNLWRIEDEGTAMEANVSAVTVERRELINGGLLLVNQWHALPPDFSDEEVLGVGTTSNYKIKVQDATVRLMPNAFDALTAMIEDANEEKLTDFIVREGYRSMERQTEMFEAEVESLSRRYSGERLIEQAKRRVNYPGTSDYQTGLSFRMDLYPAPRDVKFQQSEYGRWFTENSWKYGAVFRFPTLDFPDSSWEDKSYKTGVSVTLNLYRYVGKAHAAAMRVLDYCLEEYVEFLIDHPHICIYKDGALQYEIFRIPSEEILEAYELPVPNPASEYQASLDNMGGIVMAYTYNQ